MKKLKFVDICSGIGGFRLALESLGHKCVGFSEIDKFCVDVYKDNFDTKDELEIGDITKFEYRKLPEHDLICAGFPCQPFSMAGKRMGVLDERADIFWNILRVAKENKTPILLLENVRGLLSIDKGRVFRMMINDLVDAGYFVSYRVICGSNVTIQKRNRVYIVASRNKEYDFSKLNFEKIHYEVADILDSKEIDNSHLRIHDKTYEFLKNHKVRNVDNPNNFGFTEVLPYYKTIRTITTRYYKDGSECLLREEEYQNPRRLSTSELKRAFTFPEDFKMDYLSGTRASMLLGNSVIVKIVKEICKYLG